MNVSSSNSTGSAIKVLTWVFRVIFGGTFIFSGFVKGVDPWGTIYKFEEYMVAMGLPQYHWLLVGAMFALCAAEFLIGVMILLGCYRRTAPWCGFAFMAVMLPLTLWIALRNPVSDCGCFGEFLLISNWATFWKNVVLTAIVIWLLKFNTECPPLISPAYQWLGAFFSVAFMIALSAIGYRIQPLLDFRPYHIGGRLFAEEGFDEDSADFVFIYEKDGIQQEFKVDDILPDEEDGWNFVERKEIPAAESNHEGEKTFRVWDKSGNEDLTEEISEKEGRYFVVLMPEIGKVSPSAAAEVTRMASVVQGQGAELAAVVAGTSQEIDNWEQQSAADIEIYTADDTAIKEVARGNPAVVEVVDGKIRWKAAIEAVDMDKLAGKGSQFLPAPIVTQGRNVLSGLVALYILCMCLPFALSYFTSTRK